MKNLLLLSAFFALFGGQAAQADFSNPLDDWRRRDVETQQELPFGFIWSAGAVAIGLFMFRRNGKHKAADQTLTPESATTPAQPESIQTTEQA